MKVGGPARLLALVVLAAVGAGAVAQQAPLLTVLPREEQARRWEQRADLRMLQKRYLEGIGLYQRALALQPRDPILLNKLGIAHQWLVGIDPANFKKARNFYESATRADPGYAHPWNNLGTLYYGRKDYKKAIKCYQRALKVAPAQPAFHSNLGTALFARKRYVEALEEYRVALLLDPEVFEHRSPFGVILQEQSVEDRARYHFMLAKGFASLGYMEKSLAYLRRALEDGFSPVEAQGDPVFALLRDDPRFQALFAEQPTVIPR